MKRLFTKFLAMALTAAMLFELLPAANAVATNAVTVDDGYADSHVVGEVNEERTETGKRFRLADGSYAAVEYGAPIHFADADGNWQDIDNTLALQNADRTASVRTYESVNGTHEKDFAANLSNGFLFSSSSGDRRVGMFLLDPLATQVPVEPIHTASQNAAESETAEETEEISPATETPAAESSEEPSSESQLEVAEPAERETVRSFNPNATAQISYPADKQAVAVQSAHSSAETEKERLARETTPSRISAEVLYQNVFSNVDLQYEIFSYHVKESIVLNRKCDSYAFDFYLDLQGLTPALQDDGSVFLLDGEKIIYYLPAPYMFDDSGAESDAVSYTLSEQATGTWKLTVTADKAWIEAEDRVFPVTIDPTLIDNSSTSEFQGDTVASLTDEPVSNKNNIACGYHPTNGRMEAYFKLTDFPTVPEGCTLARAYVGLYQNDFRSSIGDGTGGKLCLYMQANTTYAPMNSSLTWATRPSYSEVLDYVDTDYWNVDSTVLWDITPAAKGWYDGTMPNYGLAMTSNGNTSTKCRAWFSYFRVSFIVSYRNVNGIEPYYTYQTLGLGNAGTAYLSDFTGQLTLAKTVCSYASTVNPFSLSLYYNSGCAAYSENYDVPCKLGLNMHFGSGVGMNVVQKMEKVALQNDFSSGKTDTYLQYTDGDGTVHYFAKDGNDWKDEDGLGLKATEYSVGSFRVTDDNGNRMDFAGGYLSLLRDANGNEIQILYSSKQITSVVQKNKGGSAITIATFTYDSSYYLTKITDAIGSEYTLGYTNGMLTSLKRGGTTIAQYGMGSDRRMTYAYDAEAEYGIAFTYANKKISSYYEITSASTASRPGAVVAVSHPEDGRTIYCDYGADRTESSDDVLTAYVFDYAGRTVNAYTTDPDHNILGASAAVYSGAGTTDKTNNRTLRTATLGAVEANLLRNGSFEFDTPAWTFQSGSGSLSAGSAGARTGQKGFVGSATADTTMTASFQTDNLSANRAYTLSGYVKTTSATGFLGDGIYLKVTAPSGTAWTSEKLNVKTSSGIDSGWTRLSVNFTAPATGSYTVSVVADGLTGSFYADDLQLEQGETPSTLNLLRNADMQVENDGWSLHTRAAFCNGIGLPQEVSGAYSLRIYGDAYTNCEAYQEVAISLPGTQTYVLSGWAKALSLPDNVKKNDDPAQDLEKQFGLRAILTYTDGSTEYHYTAFNPDVRGWQFASCTIVPKQTGKTVRTIRVVCAYEKNCNTAYFDNLSLTREVAQTMHYDADGNLVSVKSTGKKEETAAFENGNLISVNTGGSGTFTYTYDGNHNVTRASNGVIRQDYTYDSMGNVTGTSLKADSGSGSALTSSATYTNGGNLLASATDGTGQTLTYAYGTALSKMTGQATSVTDAQGNRMQSVYNDFGRVTQKTFANDGKLQYTYNKGLLRDVTRTADEAGQSIACDYDAFGNLTAVRIGGLLLASYQYAAKNGQLMKQVYGNGQEVTFTYDRLGRTNTASYSGGRTLTYAYNGDGQLYSIRDDAGTETAADDVTYFYTYDSLKRAIACRICRGIEQVLSVHWEYDDSSRIKTQAWQMGQQSYSESYTYSAKDGSLTSVSMNGGSLQLGYDALSRLSTASNGVYTRNYTYRGISTSQTTTQVEKLRYTGLNGALSGLTYNYTYNPLGNIASVTSGSSTSSYTYDAMGQLTAASLPGMQYAYNYDGAGNLRTVTRGGTTNTYTYGSASWKDLLTAFNGEKIVYEGQTMDEDGNITGTPTSGNPIRYYNGTPWNFSWAEGRSLKTAESSTPEQDISLEFSYDADGLRIEKRVTKTVYEMTAEHTYTDTVIAPTCTEAGYTVHTCECGDSYTDTEVPALGHDYAASNTPGLLACTRCEALLEHSEHSYTETVVAPTCTEAGYTLHTCECGDSYRENEIAALGHKFVRGAIVPPTCTEDGYRNFRCSRCGERKIVTIPALGHDIVNNKCTRCGYVGGATLPTVPPSQGVTMSLEEPTEPEVPLQNEPDEPADDTPDTPPTENAPLHRGAATEIEEIHQYIYAGRKLLRETISDGTTTKTLDFTYDNVGMPYSLIYNNGTTTTTYYYITNLQGDVMYLVDSSGNEVAAYDYDPYGKIISATGDLAGINPLRYRGYYYDSETGFYYLQSRYYDPEICRFINADSYASTGQSYLGYNMFAYCANNPIAYTDLEGEAPWSALPYWGYIHDLVVENIVIKYSNSKRTLSSEVSCSTGRMDIFDESSGEVWEVKSAGPASLIGVAQLYRYTQGTHNGMPIIIGRETFSGEFDRGNFHVKYWTVASGLIVYDFSYKGKEKEIVTVSAYEKQESEQKSTPKVGGIAMAAAGALGAGQAGAAIVSAIGGPLTSFKRNYYCFQ